MRYLLSTHEDFEGETMSRILASTTCILFFVTASVQGGDYADLSRAYAAQKAEFTHQYHAQLAELRHANRRSRDRLIAERQLIARIDCHETRSARLRANSRDLGALARENGRLQRELSLAYTDGLRALRDEYNFARDQRRYANAGQKHRNARTNRHVTFRSYDAHPADCSCTACVPDVPTRQFENRVYRDRGVGYHDSVPHRKPNGIDIAVAILSMLR